MWLSQCGMDRNRSCFVCRIPLHVSALPKKLMGRGPQILQMVVMLWHRVTLIMMHSVEPCRAYSSSLIATHRQQDAHPVRPGLCRVLQGKSAFPETAGMAFQFARMLTPVCWTISSRALPCLPITCYALCLFLPCPKLHLSTTLTPGPPHCRHNRYPP